MAEKNKFNNLDDEDMFVTLDLDDGSSMECQILTIFEADGRDYIALLPVDEDEQPNEDGEVFIYRYSEDAEGNPSLENIEDDEEYEVVSDRFDELLDEAEFEDLDDLAGGPQEDPYKRRPAREAAAAKADDDFEFIDLD